MDTPAEAELVTAYLQQRDALRRFCRARLGAQADVEDLLQDLYLKVSALPPEGDVRDVRAFLYRLASNLMFDRLRSARRAAARDSAWREVSHAISDGEDIQDAPDAEQIVAAKERLEAVMKAVSALPPKTQKVFRMHKFDGLSYAEVASRLGVSRSSVEKHMMDALRSLTKRVPR